MEDFSLQHQAKIDPNAVPDEVLGCLEALSDAQLMNLRHHLDNLLGIEINNLNLSEELGLVYRQGKDLLKTIQADDRVPANQKAQVYNSVAAQIDKLSKMRDKVFSQERLKRFEAALIKTIECQGDNKAKSIFFDLYGEFLRDRGE